MATFPREVAFWYVRFRSSLPTIHIGMSGIARWLGLGSDELYREAVASFDSGAYFEASQRLDALLAEACDPSLARLAKFQLSECYRQLGLNDSRLGRGESAIQWLGKAIAICPGYPDLHLSLARAYRTCGKRLDERRSVQQALELNPHYVEAMLHRALNLYETGAHADAMDWLEHAVLLEPALRGECYDHIIELHLDGRHSAAAGELSVAAIPEDGRSEFNARLGDDLLRRGEFETAAEAFAAALDGSPRRADLRCRYAEALTGLGDYNGALMQLRLALSAHPRSPDAHAQIAVVLRLTGLPEHADRHLRLALRYQPDHAVAVFEHERRKIRSEKKRAA